MSSPPIQEHFHCVIVSIILYYTPFDLLIVADCEWPWPLPPTCFMVVSQYSRITHTHPAAYQLHLDLLLYFGCCCVGNRCAGVVSHCCCFVLPLSLWWSIFGADVFDGSEMEGSFPPFSFVLFYTPRAAQGRLAPPFFNLKLSTNMVPKPIKLGILSGNNIHLSNCGSAIFLLTVPWNA